MVRHIVMWRLAGGTDRDAVAAEMKARLEGLVGRVPALDRLEVGIDAIRSEAAADVVLITEFASWAALDAYRTHPEHRAVVDFIRGVVADRWVVDYEH